MDLNLIYYAFVKLYLPTRRSTGEKNMTWTFRGVWIDGTLGPVRHQQMAGG